MSGKVDGQYWPNGESIAMSTEVNDARQQAIYKLEGIKEMISRLEHIESCDDDDDCQLTNADIARGLDCTLGELHYGSARAYHDHDAALEAITESPLSVEVRSGWYQPGSTPEATEYQILLCTGRPAVKLVGELGNDSEPTSANLEYQDWGTPWTLLHGFDTIEQFVEAKDTLLAYARQFWFGE